MKAVAVRDGLYEGKRIRKGETFEFDAAKYKTKAKNPWFLPADRARIVHPPKQGPITLKEAGGSREGKGFVAVMKDLAKGVGLRVERTDDLAK